MSELKLVVFRDGDLEQPAANGVRDCGGNVLCLHSGERCSRPGKCQPPSTESTTATGSTETTWRSQPPWTRVRLLRHVTIFMTTTPFHNVIVTSLCLFRTPNEDDDDFYHTCDYDMLRVQQMHSKLTVN